MVTVEMKGRLEPVQLEGGFIDAVNALNLSAASGKAFIISKLESGEDFAMNMQNILTIKGENDEEYVMPGAV